MAPATRSRRGFPVDGFRERRIDLLGLAILAAIAPLLGLLGTVTGIIQTFGVLEAFGNANPSLMSGGISEALVTTATGLVIALPIGGSIRGRAAMLTGAV